MQHLQKTRGGGPSISTRKPTCLRFKLYSPFWRSPLLEVAKSTLLILSALFPVVNPLGGSPVFLALTREYPASARRILARTVAMNSFVLLIASFLLDSHILASPSSAKAG